MGHRIPTNKMIVKRKACSKATCEGCGKLVRVRTLILFKSKFLCTNCRNKLPTARIQQSATQIGKGYISLEDALNKTYEIKRYTNKNGHGQAVVSFPSCLAEKFIKITLVNPEEVKNEKRNKNR